VVNVVGNSRCILVAGKTTWLHVTWVKKEIPGRTCARKQRTGRDGRGGGGAISKSELFTALNKGEGHWVTDGSGSGSFCGLVNY
jgi:hypothetical protein